MQWPAFGWIFPLACLVMMVVMLFLMMRKGGMGCMSRSRSTNETGLPSPMKRSSSEPSTSAVEILNERYVRGEIDKQEYEEKRAALASLG